VQGGRVPKEPWEWEEADLQLRITSREPESLTLDYKAAGALAKDTSKKDEIRKDVSAFANSTGGVIVYGIVEKPGNPPGTPDHLDGIDPAQFSSEWLEQVINSTIAPRIQGIRIKSVPLSDPPKGKVAYVVAIPQGQTAHQAPDKKFYKRFNFQNVPMEHYEIMDVLQRQTHPQLEGQISLAGGSSHNGLGGVGGSLSVTIQEDDA
jgi:predicted HTH transcriptional regulator